MAANVIQKRNTSQIFFLHHPKLCSDAVFQKPLSNFDIQYPKMNLSSFNLSNLTFMQTILVINGEKYWQEFLPVEFKWRE